MLRRIVAIATLLLALPATAKVVTQSVKYTLGETEFESTLVYDNVVASHRPGLLLVPNWYGANAAAIEKAKQIAGKRYVILVADVFGAGVRPKNSDEAGATIGAIYRDRAQLRARVNRALEALRAQADAAPLDAAHIGAIGFCFGGAAVLDLARSGAEVAGVVSFHGNLGTDDASLAKNIKASVLALNGADDSYVPAEQIAAFQKEMTDAGVDWQFVNLSGAVHCFAEPDQNSPPGCVYNQRAADRAFRFMHGFFDERFAAAQ
jgi:dienelactone hydrolase